MNIDLAIQEIIDQHEQKHPYSCIASAIEIVLKALRKVDVHYYDQQNKWPNRDKKLTFAKFDNETICGITFKQKFNITRNASFPFEKLFNAIDLELIANRCVMISRPTKEGWHICVVSKKQDGDFLFSTKASTKTDTETGKKTIRGKITKREIQKLGGTDILVYR